VRLPRSSKTQSLFIRFLVIEGFYYRWSSLKSITPFEARSVQRTNFEIEQRHPTSIPNI
jgi:hypothetical protein